MEWSTKEKLAIASYVMRTGEEQWGGVGRVLQPLGEPGRPEDWFSPRVCAEQYSTLLDHHSKDVKVKTDANDNVENPTSKEMIVQALTMERIKELKRFIQKEQEEYLKIQKELEMVESGALDDQLDEIWENIEAKKSATSKILEDSNGANSKDDHSQTVSNKDEVEVESSLQERVKSVTKEMKQEIEKMTLSLKVGDQEATSTNATSEGESVNDLGKSSKLDAGAQSGGENAMSYACEVEVADTIQEEKATDIPKEACMEDDDGTSLSYARSDEAVISPIKKTVKTRRKTSSVVSTSTKASTTSDTLLPKIPNIRIALNKLTIVHNRPQPDHGDETESADENVSHDYHREQMISAESHDTDDDSVFDVSKSSAIAHESLDDSKIIVNSTRKQESSDRSKTAKSPVMLQKSINDSKIMMNPKVVLEKSPDDSKMLTSLNWSKPAKDQKVASESIPEQSQETANSTPIDEQVSAHVSCTDDVTDKTSHDLQHADVDTTVPSQGKENEFKQDESVNKPSSSLKITKSDASSPSGPTNLPSVELDVSSMTAVKLETTKSDTAVSNAESPATTKVPATVSQTTNQSHGVKNVEKSSAKLDADHESCSEIVEGNEPDFDVNELVQPEGHKMAPGASKQEGYASNSGLSSSSCTQSSDTDTDTASMKAWRKSIMILWKQVASHRYASLFQQPVTDGIAPNYSGTVHRSMDLSTLKKNIESGVVRTTSEFQRDLMLMFQNAIMYNYREHDVYKMTLEMQKDVMDQVAQFLVTQIMVNPQAMKKTPRKRRKSRAGEKGQSSNRVCATTDVLLSVLVSEARSKRTAAIEGEAKFMRKKQPSHEC